MSHSVDPTLSINFLSRIVALLLFAKPNVGDMQLVTILSIALCKSDTSLVAGSTNDDNINTVEKNP